MTNIIYDEDGDLSEFGAIISIFIIIILIFGIPYSIYLVTASFGASIDNSIYCSQCRERCLNISGEVEEPKNKILEVKTIEIYEEIGKTSNISDSMGLIVRSEDDIILRNVSNYETFKEGNIYIYRHSTKNHTVIHRLVKCLDKDCNISVFKGDNNYKADKLVNKSQIKYKVEGVLY